MIHITILVYNVFTVGGVQRAVSLLSNELALSDKFNITILSMFKTSDNPYFQLNEKIIVKNIFEKPFNLKRGYIKAVTGLKKYLDRNKTDILIFAGMVFGSMVYFADKNHKIKAIGWEHNSFSFGKIFGLNWLGKRIACRRMDAVVVLTQDNYNLYKSNLKQIKKIVQIYNPADQCKNEGKYNADSKLIMSCGSLVALKGFDYAVDVAKNIFEKHPDWQWHIFGDGIERNKIEKKINQYNLQNNLILKGYCKDVYDRYKNYSIYVMTSRHEGFPMVLIEAKSNHLPIVSFDCQSGPGEIVEDGINGFLIPCFDTKKMSQKILELMENKDRAIDFSKNSSVGLDKLEISTIVHQWEELIQSI